MATTPISIHQLIAVIKLARSYDARSNDTKAIIDACGTSGLVWPAGLLGGCCFGAEWHGPLAITYTNPMAPGAHPSVPRHTSGAGETRFGNWGVV